MECIISIISEGGIGSEVLPSAPQTVLCRVKSNSLHQVCDDPVKEKVGASKCSLMSKVWMWLT
jgi:hypothetical protein